MHSQRFDELDRHNEQLVAQIDIADRNGDVQKGHDLRERLYTNKLEMLQEVKKTNNHSRGITLGELIDKVNAMPPVPLRATGVDPLDNALGGGIEEGTFMMIAGESFVGKTHLMLEIVMNIGLHSNSVFFNFEMGERRIKKRLEKAITDNVQKKNVIIDSDTTNLDDLIMEIEIYAHKGIKFFMIDSKMKISIDGKEDDHKKISEMTKQLSRLAYKREIIICLINQISDSNIKDKRRSFKGSGDQMYDADIALFYEKHKDENKRNLVCVKNRTGDENLFSLELTLRDGKTVGVTSEQEVTFESYKMPTNF